MNGRETFLNVMEYKPVKKVPNYELGVWGQVIDRWEHEGLKPYTCHWAWFPGEEFFGMDCREFININFDMLPPFEYEVLEETDRYILARNQKGIVSKGLKEGMVRGTRLCMDHYISFPVSTMEDFRTLQKRYEAALPARYEPQWRHKAKAWKMRDHVLVLGGNCQIAGFYWRAREWMGTENLSYAWYDQPELCEAMMAHFADFTIEVARPVLETTDVEYVTLNEDLSGNSGPLVGPETFKKFIFPHLKRLIEFFKSHGVRYVWLDTDGNCEPLIPLFMDAGVDLLWPLERPGNMDPVRIRKKFGKSLRLHGGVDKRELAKDKTAIKNHLLHLVPLIEEGGYIPAVDHTVPPEVSFDNFKYYMEMKHLLLEGRLK